MDLSEGEPIREIRKTIDQLKADIADLETRLREGPTYLRQGSLRNMGIRIVVLAERINKLLPTLAAKEKLNRAS